MIGTALVFGLGPVTEEEGVEVEEGKKKDCEEERELFIIKRHGQPIREERTKLPGRRWSSPFLANVIHNDMQ